MTMPVTFCLTNEQQTLAASAWRLALKIALQSASRYRFDRDEAISTASYWLCYCAAKYDPARGTKFTSYVGKSIAKAMLTLYHGCQQHHSRIDDSFRVEDVLDNRLPDPQECLIAREEASATQAALAAVNRVVPSDSRQGRILWERFVERKSNAQIAEEQGVCRERVRQIIARGVRKLRRELPQLVEGDSVTRFYIRKRSDQLREQALTMRVAGQKYGDICAALGVSHVTLWLWFRSANMTA